MARETKTIQECIDDYLTTKARTRANAPSTIERHRAALKVFGEMHGSMQAGSLRDSHVTEWRMERVDEDLAPATYAAEASAIKGLVKFMTDRRYVATGRELCQDVQKIRGISREHLRIPASEWSVWLESTRTPRDRMLLALLIYTFCRAKESSSVTWGDLRPLDSGEPGIKIYRWKTYQTSILGMPAELLEELDRYKKWYQAELWKLGLKEPQSTWPIVPAFHSPTIGRVKGGEYEQRDQKLNPTVAPKCVSHLIRPTIEELGRQLGKQHYVDAQHIGAHTCRRSGAREYWLDLIRRREVARAKGLPDPLNMDPIEHVRARLNHGSAKQTELYIGADTITAEANNIFASGGRMIAEPEVNRLASVAKIG
jgi:hypothetical protein